MLMNMATTESSTSGNHTVADDTSQFVGTAINSVANVIFIILGGAEVVSGVVGNLLLLTVVLTRNSLRRRCVHNFFIASLAVADLVSLGYWMTFFVLDLCLGHHPVVNEHHCRLNGYVIGVVYMAGILSLLSISCNRYLHVCHSHLYSRLFSWQRTITWCAALWLFSAAVALPPLLGVGSYSYNVNAHFCSFTRNDPNKYAKVMVVVFSVIPFCFVGYCNFAIFRFWKQARLRVNLHHPLLQRGNKCEDSVAKVPRLTFQPKDDAETEQPEDNCREKGLASGPGSNPKVDPEWEGSARGSLGQQDTSVSPSHVAVVAMDTRESPQATTDERDEACTSEGNTSSVDKASEVGPAVSGGWPRATGTNGKDGAAVVVLSKSDSFTRSQADGSSSTLTKIRQKYGYKKSSASTILSASTSHLHQLTSSTSHLHQLTRHQEKRRGREEAFVRSLFIVFLLIVITFIPYGVTVLLGSFLSLPAELDVAMDLVLFFNNAVNWIVYGVMNPTFRRGYKRNVKRLLGYVCGCRRRAAEGLNVSMSSQGPTTASSHRVNVHGEQSVTSQDFQSHTVGRDVTRLPVSHSRP